MKMAVQHMGPEIKKLCRPIVVAAAIWPMLGGIAAAQLGKPSNVKMNWDVGTLDMSGQHFTLTYRDAHVKLSTKAIIKNPPAPTTANDGFDNGNAMTMPGYPDDMITVDWSSAAGLTGAHHIGAQFQVQSWDKSGTSFRVVESRLTNVSGVSQDGGMFSTPSVEVPGPQSITYSKVNSAAVSLFVSDPAIVGPVTFSNVAFYKTAAEPALADLAATTFPLLPKTFLMGVPDFVLNFGGPSADFVVPGIDDPEWLIVTATQKWLSPALSGLTGAPTNVTINTWFAGQMQPNLVTGDYNSNGIVDAADYPMWRKLFGNTGKLAADGNGDGQVNVLDYVSWYGNFGNSAGSGVSTSVPEPATLLLVSVAFVLLPLRGVTRIAALKRWLPPSILI